MFVFGFVFDCSIVPARVRLRVRFVFVFVFGVRCRPVCGFVFLFGEQWFCSEVCSLSEHVCVRRTLLGRNPV